MIAQVDGCLSRICVTRHIGQRLLGNAEYFIFKSRCEWPVSPTYIETNGELFRGRPFNEMSKASSQSVLCGIGAKVPYAATRFCKSLAYVLPGAVYLLAGSGDLRLNEKLGSELELHRHADEALCKGVVNLAGYSVPFSKNRLEL